MKGKMIRLPLQLTWPKEKAIRLNCYLDVKNDTKAVASSWVKYCAQKERWSTSLSDIFSPPANSFRDRKYLNTKAKVIYKGPTISVKKLTSHKHFALKQNKKANRMCVKAPQALYSTLQLLWKTQQIHDSTSSTNNVKTKLFHWNKIWHSQTMVTM